MPIRKYRVDTDKGSFMVEVEEGAPQSGFAHKLDPSIKQSGDDSPVGESPSFLDNLINNPMLKGAARPQTLGDVLSLILPAASPAIPGAEFASRSWQALKGAAQDTKGITQVPSLPFRAIGKFNSALPSQMERAAAGSPNARLLTSSGPAPNPIDYDAMRAPSYRQPQPGESLPGLPRGGVTPAPSAPTPVTPPGESIPGFPRLTIKPPPEPGPVPSSLGGGAPVPPPPTVNVSGSSALPETAPAQAAGIRPPQRPINEVVPPSRSSAGGIGSDGLTDADRSAAGIKPAMRITKAPDATAERILQARGARRQSYVNEAEQESVRQSSLARDPVATDGPIPEETLNALLDLMRGGQ